MKYLFNSSDLGKEVAEHIEENLITYNNFRSLTKRSEYENKEAERIEVGKTYYQQVKAEYIKANGD